MTLKRSAAVGCGLILSACGAPYQFSDAPDILEADVILGVKCEMARFLREKAPTRPKTPTFFALDATQIAEIDLTLKTTKQTKTGVRAAAVIPLGAGASVSPWLSFSDARSRVITGTTQFVMEQAMSGKSVACEQVKPGSPAYGLADWLLAKFATESQIPVGSPRVGLGKIIVSTDFGVSQGVEFGGTAGFTPVSVTPSVAASQEDIQSIKITLRGYHVQQRYEFSRKGPPPKVPPPPPYTTKDKKETE